MSIAARLALLWLAAASTMLAFGGLEFHLQRESARSGMEAEFAMRVAAQQRAVLEEIDRRLASLARRLGPFGTMACRGDLALDVPPPSPPIVVVLVGRDAVAQCLAQHLSGMAAAIPQLSVAVTRQGQDGWAGPFGERDQGPAVMTAVHPVRGSDGIAMSAVVAVALPLVAFTELPLAPGWSLTWLDADGRTVHAIAADDATEDAIPPGAVPVSVAADLAVVAAYRAPPTPLMPWTVLVAAGALACLAGGAVLFVGAARRWIVAPLRRLEHGMLGGIGQPAAIGGLPPELRRLGAAIAARDEAWGEALAQRSLMLDAGNHRVVSTLQMIVSLLRLQADLIEDGTAEGSARVLRDAEQRVATVAAVHSSLRGMHNEAPADLQELLWSICDRLVAAYGLAGSVTVRVVVEPVPIATDEAIAVALLVTEWTTEALRTAEDAQATGTIAVMLEMREGSRELAHVTDLPVAPAHAEAGLGAAIVEGLVRQLRGRATRFDGTLHGVRVVFPLRLT